ncbi:hypothetical protein Hanom_Chr13g01213621 [Helianthus anomalus]
MCNSIRFLFISCLYDVEGQIPKAKNDIRIAIVWESMVTLLVHVYKICIVQL